MCKAALVLMIMAFSFCGVVQAQQTAVGIIIGGETVYAVWRPLMGFVAEHRKTKHSGLETGLQYRSMQNTFGMSVQVGTSFSHYTVRVNEHHLTLPILYKYYSRIVNIAAGPSFVFYLGYGAKADNPDVTINDYTRTPTFDIGALIKISKPLNVSDKLILEPEFRVNPLFSSLNTYVGFAIAGKYKLKGNKLQQ